MAEAVQRELVYFWYYFTIQFRQIFAYWMLGMALGSIVSVFGKEKIHRAFAALHGKKLGLLGVIPASLLGNSKPAVHVRNHTHRRLVRRKRYAAGLDSRVHDGIDPP